MKDDLSNKWVIVYLPYIVIRSMSHHVPKPGMISRAEMMLKISFHSGPRIHWLNNGLFDRHLSFCWKKCHVSNFINLYLHC